MEVSRQKKSYEPYFEEVSIGLQRIRKTGGCTVITIPKAIIEQFDLENVKKAIVVLLIRHKKIKSELQEGEEWVKLTKRERIMFESWSKDRQEYLEKSIE